MSEQRPTVLFEKRDDIAVVTLNRPDVVNAFSVRMRDELWEVLSAVRDDPDVRGMLLVGAGERGFCAGADLTEFGTAPSQTIARQVRWERDLWGLLLGIPKPTVAAIHGYCLGSGLEMAALCDMRVAADDAVFGMPEAGLGLVPAAGGTQLLPRLLGPGRALEVLLSGRRFGAEDALAYGLVSEVVPRSELVAAATALLRRVLRAPKDALAAAKRVLTDGADRPLAAALDLERRLAASLSA